MNKSCFPPLIRNVTAVLVAAACVAGLSGCMKLGGKPLDQRYYNIEAARPNEPGEPVTDKTLRVRRVHVSPRYDGREIVYNFGGGRYEADFYNQFFIQPADMLTQNLREWMEASHIYAHAVDPSSLAASDHILEGIVNSLYGDDSSGAPKAVVEMQFYLLDGASGGRTILFSRSYREEVPLESNSAAALVQGMDAGVADIYGKLEADLRVALAK